MKKVFLMALFLFVFAGCNEGQKITESQKQLIEQHKIAHWNTLIEEERIRLKIPQEAWMEYLNYKRKQSGDKEYSWGKNWRERVLTDAEKDLHFYIIRQQVITSFQVAYPDNWQAKLLEYDIEQNKIAQAAQLQQLLGQMQWQQEQQRRLSPVYPNTIPQQPQLIHPTKTYQVTPRSFGDGYTIREE